MWSSPPGHSIRYPEVTTCGTAIRRAGLCELRGFSLRTLRPRFAPFAVKGLISPEASKTLNRKGRKVRIAHSG